MTAGERLRRVLSPPAAPTKHDTGLRFTDILFGFVIRELFLRLQNWESLPWFVRWQLIASAVLVLGSWIGFRRSLNRSDYEVKFFNLPFFRFLLDQLMVILYFRIAVLTPHPYTSAQPDQLAEETAWILVAVFILYAVWDVLGIWMAAARAGTKYKYPRIENGAMTTTSSRKDVASLVITAEFALFALLLSATWGDAATTGDAERFFIAAIAVLLGYRWVKEIKSSWGTG